MNWFCKKPPTYEQEISRSHHRKNLVDGYSKMTTEQLIAVGVACLLKNTASDDNITQNALAHELFRRVRMTIKE